MKVVSQTFYALIPHITEMVHSIIRKKQSCNKEFFWYLETGGTFDKTLFTNPSARAGYDTRSIFKRSLTGLNSEFSFS